MNRRPEATHESFEQEVQAKNLQGVLLFAGVLFFLNPIFGVVDRFVFDEHLELLLALRIFLQCLSILVLALSRVAREFMRRNAMTTILLAAATVAWSIEAMVFLGQGYGSPYYAGILLAVVTAGYVALAPRRAALVFAVGVYLPFGIPAVFGASLHNLFYFVTHQLMVALTLGIVVVGMGFRYTLEERAFSDRQRLKDLDRAKNQFFANISHELRTPLTLVLAPLEALLEDPELGKRLRSQLLLARRNALRLLKLVDDLLELSRLESAGMRLRLQSVDLIDLANDLVERIRPLAARKEITVAMDHPEALPAATCDSDQIERALLNILANAVKFTSQQGKVTVKLRRVGDLVEMAVSDTGEGIPAEHLARIFDRFHQVDPTGTRRHGGTGIGLALAREIVELHGGRTEAESVVGHGTTIRISIPLSPSVPDHAIERRQVERLVGDERRSTGAGMSEWHHALRQRDEYRLLHIDAATERRLAPRVRNPDRSECVLIVEDSADMVQFLAALLSPRYEVFTAMDGIAGLETARARRPDLIISDVMMPRMSGFELIRELRADQGTAQIPVILLTARGAPMDKVEGREGGADIYLTKPFQPSELRAAVRRLLEREEHHADTAIEERERSLLMLAEGAAHEILNPLGFLQNALYVMNESACELAEHWESPAEDILSLRDDIERSYAAGTEGIRRVREVIEDLRRFSRGGGPGMPGPARINEVVRRVCTLVGVRGVGIAVEQSLDATRMVSLRQGQIEQVLLNLFINARRASSGECRVRVRTWDHERGGIGLEIQDDGPGIPEAEREKIFAPFYTTGPAGTGMGLGLSVARRLVREHGGSISAGSGADGGASFAVWLPEIDTTERHVE